MKIVFTSKTLPLKKGCHLIDAGVQGKESIWREVRLPVGVLTWIEIQGNIKFTEGASSVVFKPPIDTLTMEVMAANQATHKIIFLKLAKADGAIVVLGLRRDHQD